MRLRSLVLFGAGIATGLAIARKLTEDDPNVQHGPTNASSANPAVRALAGPAQRLADRATVVSLDAIRRARGAIQQRLAEGPYDDATWN
ncbi:MAG TPA: hypothetical protein VK646_02840 [Actinomycetota bacterium]|nr:hypothetical protein [Actinomycetota bacterium]